MRSNISGTTPCFNREKSDDADFLASLQETTEKETKNQKNGSLKANGLKVEKLFERSSYFETDLKWKNIIGITTLHIVVLYTTLTFPFLEKKALTFYSKYLYSCRLQGLTLKYNFFSRLFQ